MSDRDPVSHRPRVRPVVLVAPPTWPAESKGWLAVTKRDWDEFGSTDLAGLVQPGQLPTLRYLFELRDRRERWLRATRGSNALAAGSMGQEVVNPLIKQMPSLNREIRALEAQFGMTPTSLKKLVGSAGPVDPEKPTLAQLLDMPDDEDERADPRLVVLRGLG